MKPNSNLTIVIPTYNRARYLDRCLELLIPSARKHNIAIYISDNASEDETESVFIKRRGEYPFIEYSRNTKNLGPDRNFELALNMPTTEYIWLLGDTYQIKPDSIEFMLNLIADKNSNFDVIVFNVAGRVKNIQSRTYREKNELLRDLGWHMTCLSSLVYKRKLIKGANFGRYRKTSFIQTGIVFEYIENREFFVLWEEGHSVLPIFLKGVVKESWQDSTFEIWVEKWTNFIFSLPPSYDVRSKLQCIKDHGLKSGLFSLRHLLALRASGILNLSVFKKYYYLFPTVIDSSLPVLFLISLTPKFFPKMMKRLFFVKMKTNK